MYVTRLVGGRQGALGGSVDYRILVQVNELCRLLLFEFIFFWCEM